MSFSTIWWPIDLDMHLDCSVNCRVWLFSNYVIRDCIHIQLNACCGVDFLVVRLYIKVWYDQVFEMSDISDVYVTPCLDSAYIWLAVLGLAHVDCFSCFTRLLTLDCITLHYIYIQLYSVIKLELNWTVTCSFCHSFHLLFQITVHNAHAYT